MIGKNRKVIFASLSCLVLALCVRAQSVADITDITPKVDDPPVPVKTVAPDYPPDMRRDKISGAASILVVIGEKGDVIAAEVNKASRDEFREPALEAVKKWKFKPAELAGKAVKVRVNIPVRFSVD